MRPSRTGIQSRGRQVLASSLQSQGERPPSSRADLYPSSCDFCLTLLLHGGGGGRRKRSGSRVTRACEFSSTPRYEARRERRDRKRRGGAFVSFCVFASRKKEAERRQTWGRTVRAFGAAARASARARLSAFHHGVFLEMSEHLRPASGHASWDAAATISSLDGRYPPLPVPVQCAPHGRPRLPAADAQSRPGAVCNSARGHRPRSRTAMCLRGRSFH
jgi:hypothetical protein